MTLTLVTTHRSTPSPDAFVTWLTSERGAAATTARAYAGDVVRLGLTSDTPVAAHRRVAQSILDAPLAASTRSRRLAAASQFFTFTHPAVESNPYRTARRPRTGVILPAVVTSPEQARATVDWLRGDGTDVRALTYAAAVALMAGAGLRVGEVASLTWGDVDVERGCVRATGKGDKTRDVPFGEFAAQVVRCLYDARSALRTPRDTDAVVDVSVRSIQRKITAAGKALGVRGLHPHAFRHGFATAVFTETKDLVLTGDLLGHASVQTTRVYTHIADDRRVSAVAVAL
jgi:site-specific recombinase XerD